MLRATATVLVVVHPLLTSLIAVSPLTVQGAVSNQRNHHKW